MEASVWRNSARIGMKTWMKVAAIQGDTHILDQLHTRFVLKGCKCGIQISSLQWHQTLFVDVANLDSLL